MARLNPVTRDRVPEVFWEAFDEVTADSGGIITGGPGSITINSPEMAKRRNHLTHYLRYETTFAKRIQELAILLTARAMDCPYIWNAHAPAARQAGLSSALIDAIRDGQPLPEMAPDEAAIVAYGREFFETHTVSPATVETALDQFGPQHLVELTQLMGHYTQTAFFLNAFAVDLPADRSEKVLPAPQPLEQLWAEHLKGEFETKDVEETLATMVDDAYVNHMPVNTGGRGQEALRAFYRDDFIPSWPDDLQMTPVNRVVGEGQLVDELHITFTHSKQMNWFLPNMAPTHRKIEIDIVVVVQFRGDKLATERIYWDHATVLRQAGLLNA